MEDAAKDNRTLFVRGISFDANEAALEEAFAEVGPVKQCFIIRQKGQTRHKGFGFVKYALQEDAERAAEELNGRQLLGKKIQVEVANKRAPLADRKRKTRDDDGEDGATGAKNSEGGDDGQTQAAAPAPQQKQKEQQQQQQQPAAKKAKQPAIGNKVAAKVASGEDAEASDEEPLPPRAKPPHKAAGAAGAAPPPAAEHKHRLVRTVAVGGVRGGLLPAVLTLARPAGEIEEVVSPAPEEVAKSAKLAEDGCPPGDVVFLVFKTVKSATSAVDLLNGKTIRPKKDAAAAAGPLHLWARQVSGEGAHVKKWRVILRNLPFSVNEAQLRTALSPAGVAWEVKIPRDPAGRSRGFAFAAFTSKAAAEKAISAVNATQVGGRPVAVDWAVAKSAYEAGKKGGEEADGGGSGKAGGGGDDSDDASGSGSELDDDDDDDLLSGGSDADDEEDGGGDDEEDHDDDRGDSDEEREAKDKKKGDEKKERMKMEKSRGAAAAEDGGSGSLVPTAKEKKLVASVVDKLIRKHEASPPPPPAGAASATVAAAVAVRPTKPAQQTASEKKAAQKQQQQQEAAAGGNAVAAEGNGHAEAAGGQAATKSPLQEEALGCTVFVRGLPLDTSSAVLHARFEAFGRVKAARLVMDKASGKAKGTAFVEFRAPEGAAAAADFCARARERKGPAITIGGRTLEVDVAVSQNDARRISTDKAASGSGDLRNLYLSKEGAIAEGSAAWQDMSDGDREKRRRAAEEKKTKLRSPNFVVSRTRLSIRNIPASVDVQALRNLFVAAVKQRATKAAPVVKKVQIMYDKERLDKAGKPRSRGHGFIEFGDHEHALVALRQLNNNPEPFGAERRPIVEFAIESVQALKTLEARRKKQEGQQQAQPQSRQSRQQKGGAGGERAPEQAVAADGSAADTEENGGVKEEKRKRTDRRDRDRRKAVTKDGASGQDGEPSSSGQKVQPPNARQQQLKDGGTAGQRQKQKQQQQQQQQRLTPANRKREAAEQEAAREAAARGKKRRADEEIDVLAANGNDGGRHGGDKQQRRRKGGDDTDALDAMVEQYKARLFGGGGGSASGAAKPTADKQPQARGGRSNSGAAAAAGASIRRWFE